MSDPYFVKGLPENINDDHIVKATAMDGYVKACAIRTTEVVRAAQKYHNTSDSVTAALGRFMTASLLISENMKNENDTQTSIIKCDGLIKGMTCVCDSSFNCRAYPVNNRIDGDDVPNVKGAVGNGTLTIIRDIGLREPYCGQVELMTGGIGEDFTYYLMASEQTPSIVALGVLQENGTIKHAGGMMIQLLPGATEEDIDYLEKRVNGGFPEITFLMSEGLSPEKIVDMFLGDPEICFLSGEKVGFNCNCSAEKMSRGLATLGKADLQELANDPKGIDIECHFCNSKYHFTSEDVKKLMEEAGFKDVKVVQDYAHLDRVVWGRI